MLRKQESRLLRPGPQQPSSLGIKPGRKINSQILLHCPALQGKPFCFFRQTQTREIKSNSNDNRLKIIFFLFFRKNSREKYFHVKAATGYSHTQLVPSTNPGQASPTANRDGNTHCKHFKPPSFSAPYADFFELLEQFPFSGENCFCSLSNTLTFL